MPLDLEVEILVKRMRGGEHAQLAGRAGVALADHLCERLAGELALQVPEGNVERREREMGDSASIAVPPGLFADVVPDPDVLERILADQLFSPAADERHRRAGARRKLRDRLAPADGTIRGLHPDEREITRPGVR